MQLERDADPSFQKVEAPQATNYPKYKQGGEIIGYIQLQPNKNDYEVRRISEVHAIPFWECLKKLTGIQVHTTLYNRVCTVQQYDANDNRMVCIQKVN